MLSRAAAVLTKLHSRGFFDLKVDFVELNLQSVAKRTAVLLCVLTMTAQTAWADDTYTFSGGSGTQSDPYLISTPGDIQHLATSVNSGTTGITWDGVYFEQTNDIDYGSYKAWPIGRDSNHRFGGHYNGRSFAIRNYKYSNVDERYKCCGLFGYVCGASNGRGGYEPCSLENIVLENCNIDSRELSETGYTAGICAYAYAATISNCRVTGTIQGPSYTGGITAHYSNYSTIKNCFADVTVVTTSNSQTNKGKIIGYTPIGLSNVTGNYYYDNGDGVPGCGGTYVSYTDSQIAAVRSVTIPNGLNVSPAPAVTYAGIKYFIPGTTITLSTGSDNTIIVSPTVSGAQSYTIDDHSITLTVGTNDVTVSGRVVTVRGSCGTNATWQLADTDGNGTYETLTISGSGTMQNYSYTTVDGLWRTNAPWGWQELTTVIVSDGITSIGDYAFIGAQNVKSVTIGNSVTTIGRGAINHCDQLTTVTLPASVTSIGVGAFENCQALTTIYINHDGAVSLPGSNANAFNAPHLMYIIFPGTAGVLANTATTGNWAPYKDKLRAKLGSQHFGVTTEGGTAIYTIATEADLRNLATLVNQDGQYCSGLTFRQTADITLNGTFTPVGNYTKNGTKYSWFEGTYDGGNYTISNFLMENGTDYGALFNSIYNATIKNLKLSWGSSTLCANSSASGDDTGASFVGVAKASTLQNLTTVAGTVTTVSASKDFGGIVGYLMAGSTVDSCTNALNVASLKNTGRKCGGIAIITQKGTGTAVIRNCKNSGTVTAANKGGILGYVGAATEIDGCENTAALQLFHFQSGSVTASGVNKGNATVASNDKSDGVSGLCFATVDGDVATFVADNALALNGEYKVMSAGATATFAFAEAGSISFDTNLFQNVTFNITMSDNLQGPEITTANGVVTYTVTASTPAYPTYLESANQTIKDKYDVWKTNYIADVNSEYEAAFLLNANPQTLPVGSAYLRIASITQVSGGWELEITSDATTLTAESNNAGIVGNGYLAIKYASDLATLASGGTSVNLPVTVTNGKITVTVTAAGAKFMKATLSTTPTVQQ